MLNHEWWKPDTFADLGTVPAARIAELSEGRMSLDVPVLLNRAVVEHDIALVVGPVLPHEVVGISGGNKYFFPGVGGQKIIDVSHWLGALITSAEIIGTTGITPVRALIDDGAALVPSEKLAICAVTAETADGEADSGVDAAVPSPPVRTSGLHSVSFGDTRASWASAAQVCAATHVTYLDAPVRRVLSIIPEMYDEIWTGAKGFYKLEPVVADGGEVILYAPHIREISSTHKEIHDIGYHCRDYFVKQWDRFSHVHWGVLAHSTHLRGAGTYDAETGRGAAAGGGDAGDGDPGGGVPRGEPGLPRPGVGRRRGVRGRPGHAGRAAGRGDALPAALSRSRAGRLAHHELDRQLQGRAVGGGPAGQRQHVPDAGGPGLAHRGGDGGQPRVDHLGQQDVVEPDDAHVRPARAGRGA